MSPLGEERVAMSVSNDSKVVVRDRSDNRAIWVRPALRRLAASKAEMGPLCTDDGMGSGGHCTGTHPNPS